MEKPSVKQFPTKMNTNINTNINKNINMTRLFAAYKISRHGDASQVILIDIRRRKLFVTDIATKRRSYRISLPASLAAMYSASDVEKATES